MQRSSCEGSFFLFFLPIPRLFHPIPFRTKPINYGLPEILGHIFVPFFLLFFYMLNYIPCGVYKKRVFVCVVGMSKRAGRLGKFLIKKNKNKWNQFSFRLTTVTNASFPWFQYSRYFAGVFTFNYYFLNVNSGTANVIILKCTRNPWIPSTAMKVNSDVFFFFK